MNTICIVSAQKQSGNCLLRPPTAGGEQNTPSVIEFLLCCLRSIA